MTNRIKRVRCRRCNELCNLSYRTVDGKQYKQPYCGTCRAMPGRQLLLKAYQATFPGDSNANKRSYNFMIGKMRKKGIGDKNIRQIAHYSKRVPDDAGAWGGYA